MNSSSKLILILCSILLLFCYSAFPQTASVEMLPATNQVAPGDIFNLEVWIYDYNMYSYSIEIYYNQAVLQINSVSSGNVFTGYSGGFPVPFQDLKNALGYLKYDETILGGTGNHSAASGRAFTIQFQAISYGGANSAGGTNILFKNIKLVKRIGDTFEIQPYTASESIAAVGCPVPDNSFTHVYLHTIPPTFTDPNLVVFGNTKVSMDATAAANENKTSVFHYETLPPGGITASFFPDPDNQILFPIIANRYWEITSYLEGPGDAYKANIMFSFAGLGGIQNPNKLRIARRSVAAGPTDAWTIIPIAQTDYSNLSGQEIGIIGSSNHEFTEGQYTIISDIGDNSLPVTLTSFTADITPENQVKLNWTTESEIDNYGFYLEKRATGDSVYNQIPGVFFQGQGNSSVAHHYVYLDKDVQPGQWEYRLKQVELNGGFNYIGKVSIFIEDNDNGTIINNFHLDQNYPNPFNPYTNINFNLPSNYDGPVDLKIFDTLGREVVNLLHGNPGPGSHQITWDGRDKHGRLVNSGVYYYRLNCDGIVLSKKMVMMK